MWGIAFSVASSLLAGKARKDQIKTENKAAQKQWGINKGLTQESLSTLDYRTQLAESEAIRDRVARNIAIKQAAKKAKGEAVVSAAQIGAAGRRVELGLERDVGRVKAEAISESNINTQIALNNITNYFNDTAKRMVDNLNQARPSYGEVPSTGEILLNAGMTAVGAYAQMDTGQRQDIKDSFSNLKSTLNTTQEVSGYGATPAGILL